MMEPFFYSMLVMMGAGVLAVLLAAPVALILTCLRPWGDRCARIILFSFLFVPLYVQAGGWNAGFGAIGWWTLTQVSAAQAPLHGVVAVIWIHAIGAFASVACLLSIGLSRIPVEREEMMRLEGGGFSLFRWVWLPVLLRWSGLGWMWTAAIVGSDMLVTNLYRLPTMTEECYLSIQSGEKIGWATWLTALPSLLLSFGVLVIVWSQQNRIFERGIPARRLTGGSLRDRFLASIVLWSILGLTFLLPLANLILKAGWDASRHEDVVTRGWSLLKMLESLLALRDSGDKFYWSFLLAIATASIATSIGLIISGYCRNSTRLQAMVLASAFLGLSLPGPIINLVVKRFCESLPTPASDLMLERSLGAPILALQFRCIPLALLCLIAAWSSWRLRYKDLEQLSGKKVLWREFVIANWRIIVFAWILCAAESTSDLASYLLVLPPGVRTVSLWIFEQLHYGVRYREAGTCLVLATLGMLTGLFASLLVRSRDKTRYT